MRARTRHIPRVATLVQRQINDHAASTRRNTRFGNKPPLDQHPKLEFIHRDTHGRQAGKKAGQAQTRIGNRHGDNICHSQPAHQPNRHGCPGERRAPTPTQRTRVLCTVSKAPGLAQRLPTDVEHHSAQTAGTGITPLHTLPFANVRFRDVLDPGVLPRRDARIGDLQTASANLDDLVFLQTVRTGGLDTLTCRPKCTHSKEK